LSNLLIMLALMTAPWLLTCVASAITRRDFDGRAVGSIGLGLLFVFTGIGHFIQPAAMAQMLPSWVPERTMLVYMTGLLEFAIAVGFFVPRFRWFTGWVAGIMLVAFFPANIYAAVNHVPVGGHAWGPVYLIVRAPVQLIIVSWIYWFTIRPPATVVHSHSSDRRPREIKTEF
jgi:uncharacterized membrane protein